jgi:hypothetical protein
MDPDDFLITFALDSGETLAVCGRDVYDPPFPFKNAEEVFGFLAIQDTPADLVYRELNAIDGEWEAAVEARLNDQPSTQRRRQDDADQRARLREEFRRS